MKLIDEQGRVFGRINVVDLVALILILIVAVVAIGSRVRAGGLIQNVQFVQRDQPAHVRLVLERELSFLADVVRPGDEVGDARGVTARVLGIERDVEDPRHVCVILWLRARSTTEGVRMFGKFLLRPGSPMRVEPAQYQLRGYVQTVEDAPGE
ncbi:MAG: DUF4330 domain-containing protein [Verrucomicrobia bacterium]|nr:DUF4330 domain-containing protein [Verrucomicrobiota bacterium]MDA1085409.1 DUF4330 domain-containing protein [Verrucomicrobiota bacterium]